MKTVLKVILIVVLIAALAAAGFVVYAMTKMHSGKVPIVSVPDETAVTAAPAGAEPAATAEPEITPEPTPSELTEEALLNMDGDEQEAVDLGIKQVDPIDPNVLNVLLVGADVRRLNAESVANADTIMMASFNFDKKTVTLVSFLRDSYIEVHGLKGSVGMNKLNSAYANGGMGWLINTLNYRGNYNLDIQYYVGVGFRNFEKMIDAVGGVDVTLTADECYYINWRCADIGKHESTAVKDTAPQLLAEQGKAVLDIADGVHHLNGLQTLWYSRDRTTGEDEASTGSDFTRTGRQQEVLQLVYDKMRTELTLPQLLSLIQFTMDNTFTNLPFREMARIGLFLLKNDVVIGRMTVPTEKSWAYENMTIGSSSTPVEVVTFKIDPNRKRLHTALYSPDAAAPTATPAS